MAKANKELTPLEREQECVNKLTETLQKNNCELRTSIIFANTWRGKLAAWLALGRDGKRRDVIGAQNNFVAR